MKNSGFSLIEIIVAIGLVAIFLPAVGLILSFSLKSSAQGENYSRAYRLAQEGMEAVIYLKSQNNPAWDWLSTPAPTSPLEYYQPQNTGGIWQLGGKTTAPAPDPLPFTRKIVIEEVRRCGLNICSDPVAPLDPNSRKITVFVSWPEADQTSEVRVDSYVTAH
ncbi:MAG: type II secretion system protein [bacterium]|nr:type II secretion system protein [bacterium]